MGEADLAAGLGRAVRADGFGACIGIDLKCKVAASKAIQLATLLLPLQ